MPEQEGGQICQDSSLGEDPKSLGLTYQRRELID
jgi:hypothetical protein